MRRCGGLSTQLIIFNTSNTPVAIVRFRYGLDNITGHTPFLPALHDIVEGLRS